MNLHHALVSIADSLENASIPDVYKTQTSDITHIVLDRFSIDDARQLSQDALQKPIMSNERVFVLVVKALPIESQNALLKLFEEPPEHTRFYLVIPQEGMMIPTLKSRVSVLESVHGAAVKNETFISFLSASYAERLSLIADIAKKKDLNMIESIITGAEEYVAKDVQKNTLLLTTTLFVRDYIKTPGASSKMLLEELALSLPQA
ncbi:MAG: DNA polymerase III delta prime subunit [Acidimicrobiales bacterium]|jgi:DNA polymerase III delta prime subunit